ncbi:pre-rRNA-processing protein TSR2 homolog [Bombina bombina]|uniref:pre-rRNA-processing protein TSR2 homolog n=1 Tax=Bombina bombina TaxID=8345 RepID=UPI00235A58CD|nr:pre-rRNA-processing protein TSR2 homolog [Bombina bombina]
MAARNVDSRGLFGEAVRTVLGGWPVLQIAVENAFGGPQSQEKADWMVGAVEQYFLSNADLEQYEVEETLTAMMNDEFDTLVEDGSLMLVAQQLCGFYVQCQRGDVAGVREQIAKLGQKKFNVKASVQAVTSSDEEGENSDDESEAMECEVSAESAPSTSGAAAPSTEPQGEEPEADGWTVVRRKKK